MKKRTFLSMLTAMFVAVAVMATVGAGQASAQQDPNCCHYIVNATNVKAACFPLLIVTTWGGMTRTEVIPAPGTWTFLVPFGCPPAQPFMGVTVVSSPGCCLVWNFQFPGGCLLINVISC